MAVFAAVLGFVQGEVGAGLGHVLGEAALLGGEAVALDVQPLGFFLRALGALIDILCGIALFAAQGLQQTGLQYTEPGKAGFITAMYIVMVPVLGLFLGRKCGWRVWVSVALAVAGLYLLSCAGVTAVSIGDWMILVSAVCFAVQILLIDHMAQAMDGLRLNCIQFIVVTVLSCAAAFAFETPSLSGVFQSWLPLVYTGVLSSGAAFSLQILGQQKLPPEPASLIMSLESVFAVLAGWVLLGQTLSMVEGIGCGLVFTGVILSQTKRAG